MLPGGIHKTFHLSPNLHGPILYGVSESKLWIRSERLEQSCPWENLAVWEEKGDWLRLNPHGLQQLHFRIDDLKNAGVYTHIMERAKGKGVKFNSPSTHAV
jgi:hypothetical protein